MPAFCLSRSRSSATKRSTALGATSAKKCAVCSRRLNGPFVSLPSTDSTLTSRTEWPAPSLQERRRRTPPPPSPLLNAPNCNSRESEGLTGNPFRADAASAMPPIDKKTSAPPEKVPFEAETLSLYTSTSCQRYLIWSAAVILSFYSDPLPGINTLFGVAAFSWLGG